MLFKPNLDFHEIKKSLESNFIFPNSLSQSAIVGQNE
jgi:hypothetical protein